MAGWQFRPDAAGIKAVSSGPGCAPALNAAATAAAGKMKGLASAVRSTSFFRFRSTIRAVPAEMVGDELVAYAGSDSPGWHLQEYGTAHDRPKSIIRRGVQQTGIRFEEGT